MPIEATGKVASETVAAMHSAPLALALLLVNLGFLIFAGFMLGKVAETSRERNTAQLSLIATLVDKCKGIQ
jgi:hypothetical protein